MNRTPPHRTRVGLSSLAEDAEHGSTALGFAPTEEVLSLQIFDGKLLRPAKLGCNPVWFTNSDVTASFQFEGLWELLERPGFSLYCQPPHCRYPNKFQNEAGSANPGRRGRQASQTPP